MESLMLLNSLDHALKVHQQYRLINTATRQEVQLEILDLYQYNGACIVYGEKMRQGIWLPATIGRRVAPPGPACFPVFPNEQGGDVVALVNQLRSLPLLLTLPDTSLLPILSLENGHLILGGERNKKEDMGRRAQQLVDLYYQWKPTLTLPQWFRLKQSIARRVN